MVLVLMVMFYTGKTGSGISSPQIRINLLWRPCVATLRVVNGPRCQPEKLSFHKYHYIFRFTTLYMRWSVLHLGQVSTIFRHLWNKSPSLQVWEFHSLASSPRLSRWTRAQSAQFPWQHPILGDVRSRTRSICLISTTKWILDLRLAGVRVPWWKRLSCTQGYLKDWQSLKRSTIST